jgi:PAS domain S-box-containing protein
MTARLSHNDPAPDTIRILHVDDEPDFADMAGMFLEREDDRFSIDTATSASEGLKQLDEGEYDCIVSDHDMPGKNGIEFLNAVREEYPDLPFILFTGKGSEEIASEAISAGVTDYLQKGADSSKYRVLANRITNAVTEYTTRHFRRLTNQDPLMILERINDAFLALDNDWRFTYVNEQAADIFGKPADELLGERIWDLFPETTDTPFYKHYRAAKSENEPRTIEEYFEPWDSWYQEYIYPSADGLSVIFRDITDQKNREERLEQTSSRLQALYENSPDMINVLNPDGTILDVNRRFSEELGYEKDEVIGKPIWEIDQLVDPEDVQTLLGGFSTGERHKFEGRYERADSSTAPVEVHLLRLELNDEDRFMAISRDITARKDREQTVTALHDVADEIHRATTEEEVAQVMVEAVAEMLDMPINGVALHDPVENVLRIVAATDPVSDAVGELPTFQPGECFAWEVFETGETSRTDDVSLIPDRHTPGSPIRSEILVPLGEHGVALIGSTEVGSFDETDVSLVELLASHVETALDRINRERDLEASEARYRSLTDDVLDTSSVGTFILDSNFEVVWLNEVVGEYLGIDREDILGADKRRLVKDHIKDRFEDSETFAETVLATYDDNTYVEEFECHILPGKDRDERWLKHWSQPITSGLYEGGRIEHYTDITERKHRENELQRQNNRLDAFASLVSHDLRNPLNVAEGRLELAQEECNSEHLDAVATAHDRMATLIEDLLTLAREGGRVNETEAVNLGELAETTCQTVETGDATVRTQVDQTIQADRSCLSQLLENLIRNAVEHGGEDVTVTVGKLADGFYVEDDGPGISDHEREAVFEVGYSTANDGTGFGLAIVKQVVDSHGWDIHVIDGANGGTRFEITGVEFSNK